MRILYVVHQFLPEYGAGTERFTYNMAKSMQRAGHHVQILTCSLAPSPGTMWQETPDSPLRHTTVDGLPVTGVPFWLLGPLANLGFESPPEEGERAWETFFQRNSFDLCHVCHPMRMAGAFDAIRRRNLPYLVTLTDFFYLCFRINLIRIGGANCLGPEGGANCVSYCNVPPWDEERLAANRSRALELLFGAAAVTACSEFVADVFARDLPTLPVRVQRHGVDLINFAAAAAAAPAPRAEGILTFGFIGTILAHKGVDVLAEAFTRVPNPEIRLRLIGPAGYDVDFVGRLREIIGRDPRITLEPPVPAEQIPALIKTFDVLCLPSIVPECFPLSLQEAFAGGVPALVSTLGFPPYVIAEEGCGLSLTAGDVGAWAAGLREVAAAPAILATWRKKIPMPLRLEEEAFFYEALYYRALQKSQAA